STLCSSDMVLALLFVFFLLKPATAYGSFTWLECRRVLFASAPARVLPVAGRGAKRGMGRGLVAGGRSGRMDPFAPGCAAGLRRRNGSGLSAAPLPCGERGQEAAFQRTTLITPHATRAPALPVGWLW